MCITLTYLIRSGWFSAVIKRLLESDREYYLSRRTFLSLTKDIYFSHEVHFFLSRRTLLSLTKNVSFSHEGHFFLSLRTFLSLTELTDLTELFCAQVRAHEEVAPPPTPPPQGGA